MGAALTSNHRSFSRERGAKRSSALCRVKKNYTMKINEGHGRMGLVIVAGLQERNKWTQSVNQKGKPATTRQSRYPGALRVWN